MMTNNDSTNNPYLFYFIDSSNVKHKLQYKLHSYQSLMEFIWDQCYEDWGDCKGRAWCATCQVEASDLMQLPNADSDELHRLGLLSSSTKRSRLACQIPMDERIQNLTFRFLGDD